MAFDPNDLLAGVNDAANNTNMINLLQLLAQYGQSPGQVPTSGVLQQLISAKSEQEKAQAAGQNPNTMYAPTFEPGGLFDSIASAIGQFGGKAPVLEDAQRAANHVPVMDYGDSFDQMVQMANSAAASAPAAASGNKYDSIIQQLIAPLIEKYAPTPLTQGGLPWQNRNPYTSTATDAPSQKNMQRPDVGTNVVDQPGAAFGPPPSRVGLTAQPVNPDVQVPVRQGNGPVEFGGNPNAPRGNAGSPGGFPGGTGLSDLVKSILDTVMSGAGDAAHQMFTPGQPQTLPTPQSYNFNPAYTTGWNMGS